MGIGLRLRISRLCWRLSDRVADALTLARLWLFDMIHDPEPMTTADEYREAERARLRKAFPKVDFDGPMR